jgi:uncharacterized protein (TIGR00290 family)
MIALSWSGGKDSARALEELRRNGSGPGVLLTTVDEETGSVTHHGVPGELLRAQAEAVGLPLAEIAIPHGAANDVYADRMRRAFGEPPLAGVTAVAFGDLFLADLRAFREERLGAAGLEALFPIWGLDTLALAREVAGPEYEAIVVSVDPSALGAEWLGRHFDEELLADLPGSIDPCGENGELHTFVTRSPAFAAAIPIAPGAVTVTDGFPRLELRLAAPAR